LSGDLILIKIVIQNLINKVNDAIRKTINY